MKTLAQLRKLSVIDLEDMLEEMNEQFLSAKAMEAKVLSKKMIERLEKVITEKRNK
jgi:hypothetical protein